MSHMTPERKKLVFHWVRAYLLIAYALAYVSGVVVFALVYDNYWASGGFAFVIPMILIRVWMHLQPPELLYMRFPVKSVPRGLWQGLWFAVFLGGVGVGLWLFARGLQKRQNWTGDSYFCSMTGFFMVAKWGLNLTIAMYELRPDIMEEETLIKLLSLMEIKGTRAESVEPVAEPASPTLLNKLLSP